MDTNLSTKIEIFISCKDLPDKDTFSKSDPIVGLYLRDPALGTWNLIDKSETVKNCLSPEFKKRFVLDYHFEQYQELKAEVYDDDGGGKALDSGAHDHLGTATLSVGELVAAPGQNYTTQLRDKAGKPQRKGTITFRCEELQDSSAFVNVVAGGIKLEKMDFFGKSDPYLEFLRIREDGSWVSVHRTETIMKTLDPRWVPFKLQLSTLCNGDFLRPILVRCYDADGKSKSELIGEFQTNVRELAESKEPKFTLLRPSSKKNPTKPRGTIVFSKFEVVRELTFLDYIKGGMEIRLSIAIDFTGSNGHPDDVGSLHYRRGTGPNQYEQAIHTIGTILADYDPDKRIPVYGFGAKVGSSVSHCFPLTFDPAKPEVLGVPGVMAAYRDALNRVLLSGPTYFSQILRAAEAHASEPFTHGQHYSILLILTDGIINDMKETVAALVSASDKPLSIVIVGVGTADFKQMEFLDGDAEPLSSGGRRAARDCVQFVPMVKFAGKHISLLAQETLAEIPQQILSFAKLHNLMPGPPRAPAPAAAPPPYI